MTACYNSSPAVRWHDYTHFSAIATTCTEIIHIQDGDVAKKWILTLAYVNITVFKRCASKDYLHDLWKRIIKGCVWKVCQEPLLHDYSTLMMKRIKIINWIHKQAWYDFTRGNRSIWKGQNALFSTFSSTSIYSAMQLQRWFGWNYLGWNILEAIKINWTAINIRLSAFFHYEQSAWGKKQGMTTFLVFFFLQWLTARIQVFLPTRSGKVRLSTVTSHSGASSSTIATLDITSSAPRCSPASQWDSGTNHYRNALVKWHVLKYKVI